jgi:hypothetical protein
MPSLAQCKTDIDAVITDIGSTTAYVSLTPAAINTDSPSGLQQSAINLHQLLSLLLHDAGLAPLWQPVKHKA